MRIIGAGLAGCIAAHVFPEAHIYEAASGPQTNHHALLRFKTDAIAKLTGIPFKKVDMQKMIWFEGKEVPASPRMNNLYSMKVAGKYEQRSISKLNNDVRYIAPNDFHMQLLNRLKNRISYSCELVATADHNPLTISTVPLPVMNKIFGKSQMATSFDSNKKEIIVTTCIIHDCELYVTCYYPDPSTYLYRASITGNKLIIESTKELQDWEYISVFDSLGIYTHNQETSFEIHKQKNGKLTEDKTKEHKQFIHHLTINHNIYSLGRFAIWRNVLLDDVLEDCYVIRKMISQDSYQNHLQRNTQ